MDFAEGIPEDIPESVKVKVARTLELHHSSANAPEELRREGMTSAGMGGWLPRGCSSFMAVACSEDVVSRWQGQAIRTGYFSCGTCHGVGRRGSL